MTVIAADSRREASANTPARTRDYMPLVDRNNTNGLSQAEEVRDRIYSMFEEAARTLAVKILILRSDPFVSPPRVAVECWVRHPRSPAVTLRSVATISVHPREFHRFPYVYDVQLTNDKRSQTISNVITLDAASVDSILNYLIMPQVTKPPRLPQCRMWGFDLWRPMNKTQRLGTDPRGVAVTVMAILGIATLMFGVGAVLLLAAGILGYYNGKRRTHVLSAGKPAQSRRLIRLDSWQVLVEELGSERDGLRETLRQELVAIPGQIFDVTSETVWHWGSDGKEEREQMVVRLRRGMLFLHIYQYGKNLFVGWDAHVNCGKWVETILSKGFDKGTDELCTVHSIAAGWRLPHEYDITDANYVIEQVHSILSRCIRLKVAEHKIDQEIDFTIVRERRQGIAGTADPNASGTVATVKSKLRRLG